MPNILVKAKIQDSCNALFNSTILTFPDYNDSWSVLY